MSTTIWVGIYGLLIGYGVGIRVSLYMYRREAKQAAAEIKAMVED